MHKWHVFEKWSVSELRVTVIHAPQNLAIARAKPGAWNSMLASQSGSRN